MTAAAPSDALRVVAPSRQELAGLDLGRPRPETIAARLPAGLAEGTHTVAWRVVSGASHPISSAFVFSVGAASAEGPAPGAAPDEVGQGVDVAFGGAAGAARRHRLARGLGIGGLVVGAAGLGVGLMGRARRRDWAGGVG